MTGKPEVMRDDLPPATQQPAKDAADSSVWFVSRQPVFGLSSIYTIDFLHDPLGPLNSCSNQGFRPRAWLGIKEIFCRLQMTRHQDSSHNREHSFATFFHDGSLSYSLFIRLLNFRVAGKARGHGAASNETRLIAEGSRECLAQNTAVRKVSDLGAENVSLSPC